MKRFLLTASTLEYESKHSSKLSPQGLRALGMNDDTIAMALTPPPPPKQYVCRKCLVIGADALSRWVDWDDRNSCILFGDGAGAMVLEAAEGEDSAGLLGE